MFVADGAAGFAPAAVISLAALCMTNYLVLFSFCLWYTRLPVQTGTDTASAVKQFLCSVDLTPDKLQDCLVLATRPGAW